MPPTASTSAPVQPSTSASPVTAAPMPASPRPTIHELFGGIASPAGTDPHAGDPGERAASGSGAPLPETTRSKFESSLGADLGAVRIHTGDASHASATALGARAFARGSDIHFARGEYQPGSRGGEQLLAHEVAHTVQQAGGAAAPQAKLEVSASGDAAEREADRAADAMVAGAPASVTSSATAARSIQRFPVDPQPYTEPRPEFPPGLVALCPALALDDYFKAKGPAQAGWGAFHQLSDAFPPWDAKRVPYETAKSAVFGGPADWAKPVDAALAQKIRDAVSPAAQGDTQGQAARTAALAVRDSMIAVRSDREELAILRDEKKDSLEKIQLEMTAQWTMWQKWELDADKEKEKDLEDSTFSKWVTSFVGGMVQSVIAEAGKLLAIGGAEQKPPLPGDSTKLKDTFLAPGLEDAAGALGSVAVAAVAWVLDKITGRDEQIAELKKAIAARTKTLQGIDWELTTKQIELATRKVARVSRDIDRVAHKLEGNEKQLKARATDMMPAVEAKAGINTFSEIQAAVRHVKEWKAAALAFQPVTERFRDTADVAASSVEGQADAGKALDVFSDGPAFAPGAKELGAQLRQLYRTQDELATRLPQEVAAAPDNLAAMQARLDSAWAAASEGLDASPTPLVPSS